MGFDGYAGVIFGIYANNILPSIWRSIRSEQDPLADGYRRLRVRQGVGIYFGVDLKYEDFMNDDWKKSRKVAALRQFAKEYLKDAYQPSLHPCITGDCNDYYKNYGKLDHEADMRIWCTLAKEGMAKKAKDKFSKIFPSPISESDEEEEVNENEDDNSEESNDQDSDSD